MSSVTGIPEMIEQLNAEMNEYKQTLETKKSDTDKYAELTSTNDGNTTVIKKDDLDAEFLKKRMVLKYFGIDCEFLSRTFYSSDKNGMRRLHG